MAPRPLWQLLEQRRGELLMRWNDWVRREVGSREMPESELIDSMPAFIDQLISVLSSEADTHAREDAQAGKRISARVHGSERLRQGFDVTSVVREYNLLERSILDLAENAGQELTPAEIRSFSDVVSDAQAEAIAEYQRKRDSEQSRQAAEHLAFLAHELRNPLSAAMTAFALLRGHVAAPGVRFLGPLERGLRKLMDLLDQALISGRAQSAILTRVESLDLGRLAREIAEESAAEAENRRIEVKVESADELILLGDARLLRSVLSNLVGNAIKFSVVGSPVLVRAHRAHDTAIVEVEDSCGGLPPEKVTAIFDPHVQIGSDRSGFGLGLAIAKQAAEAHGGTLQVQNMEGRGCCFRVELPLQPQASPVGI